MRESWRIQCPADALWLGGCARRFAEEQGFPGEDPSRIGLAVSELVNNVLKYAGLGRLVLELDEAEPDLLVIVVEDEGAGIQDLPTALQDGVSEGRRVSGAAGQVAGRRGLGCGLGAVQRLMDGVEISNRPEGGVRIRATKRRVRGRWPGRSAQEG
ncbi:MAG TPA: ATP-binding protein [Myxococcota bacterium]|nr:ATP-binding protein [Myxococcota bacterium]HRY95814.1 ATP-binding protein [Myxococcota bacterium]